VRDRADKVGIPDSGVTQSQIQEAILDGVLHTSGFGRVCCRSLKTEERELKASTGHAE